LYQILLNANHYHPIFLAKSIFNHTDKMPLSFLIPLVIAAVTLYGRYQAQEEIVVVLCTILGGLGVFASFIMAPGIIQMLILAAGLWGMRYI
jgi:hypothetical protein